ncbi:hypothetical protein ABW21_db0209789 [Orbilia brochopaga]|nr:hypothetical protein ABW21_db0209789 [Drechslerella brochopaga]
MGDTITLKGSFAENLIPEDPGLPPNLTVKIIATQGEVPERETFTVDLQRGQATPVYSATNPAVIRSFYIGNPQSRKFLYAASTETLTEGYKFAFGLAEGVYCGWIMRRDLHDPTHWLKIKRVFFRPAVLDTQGEGIEVEEE